MTDIRDEVAAALEDEFWMEEAPAESGCCYPSAVRVVERLAARGLTVVREWELDVETLTRAMERAMAAVDDEWTIPEFSEITATEYTRLARQPEDQ